MWAWNTIKNVYKINKSGLLNYTTLYINMYIDKFVKFLCHQWAILQYIRKRCVYWENSDRSVKILSINAADFCFISIYNNLVLTDNIMVDVCPLISVTIICWLNWCKPSVTYQVVWERYHPSNVYINNLSQASLQGIHEPSSILKFVVSWINETWRSLIFSHKMKSL